MRNRRKLARLVLVSSGLIVLSMGAAGCKGSDTDQAEGAPSEPATTEHPAGEEPKPEHPKGEHPDAEHPK